MIGPITTRYGPVVLTVAGLIMSLAAGAAYAYLVCALCTCGALVIAFRNPGVPDSKPSRLGRAVARRPGSLWALVQYVIENPPAPAGELEPAAPAAPDRRGRGEVERQRQGQIREDTLAGFFEVEAEVDKKAKSVVIGRREPKATARRAVSRMITSNECPLQMDIIGRYVRARYPDVAIGYEKWARGDARWWLVTFHATDGSGSSSFDISVDALNDRAILIGFDAALAALGKGEFAATKTLAAERAYPDPVRPDSDFLDSSPF